MECDICSRDDNVDFFCVSCARGSIYPARLESAQVLLEKENLARSVDDIINPRSTGDSATKETENSREIWKAEHTNAQKLFTKGRIEETRSRIGLIRQDLEEMRKTVAERKASLAVRRDVIDTVNNLVPSRQQRHIDTITEVRDKGATSFNTIHNRAMNTRAFLCRETATLLRLKQKKKSKSGIVREQHHICGLTLPDLREINNVRCADLTAALTSAAHLVILVSFYLGIRLPAEITAPHRDYPLPTINTPANSYLGVKTPFPGSGSVGTAASSPFSSKHETKGSYRPRPLFIGSDDPEEKVAQFAKKDPAAFSFFVEGISLLAWNVSWLNRSQGFSGGTTSWEDICDIGRNLWQLIYLPPQSAAVLRVLSAREAQKRQQRSNSTSSTHSPADNGVVSLGRLGQTSHSSAHSFLGQTAAYEQNRAWKYSKWNAISDSLKKHLLTEMNNAEWEMLHEQEWDDGGEQFDEAVFVRTRNLDGHEFDDARSIMTTRTPNDDGQTQPDDLVDGNKPKGTSGWTKLKTRDKDKPSIPNHD